MISVLGDKIFQVALAWWVLQTTGSGVAMGSVFLLNMLPMLVFLLIGGVLVDRFSRFALMVVSDVVRGFVIGVAAVLAYANLLELWHVYVFSFIFGAVDAFFQPAFRAVMPEMIPPEDLPSANSLASLGRPISGILGPSLGAAIVLVGGTALAFYLDALSFAISALCVLPLVTLRLPRRMPVASNSILGDLQEGIGTVLGSPMLWLTILIAGISSIAYAAPMEVGLPFLIQNNWQGDVGLLGAFFSTTALGALLAAVWLGRVTRLRHRGPVLYAAWALIGLLIIALGLPITTPLVIIVAFALGICQTTIDLNWINILQEKVPIERLGRVTSVDYLGSFVLLPLGYALGGWAIDHVGPATVFVVGGAALTVLVLLGLLHPRIRATD